MEACRNPVETPRKWPLVREGNVVTIPSASMCDDSEGHTNMENDWLDGDWASAFRAAVCFDGFFGRRVWSTWLLRL